MYFTYKPKIVPENYFNLLYEDIKDKVEVNASRKSCLYHLHNIELYSYDNIPSYKYNEVPLSLNEIRTIVEKNTEQIYDYVLVHIYEDGNSIIGYHRDKEALNSYVCSVSLGATRKFRFREIGKKSGYDYQFSLASGDIILMHKPTPENNFVGCQSKFLHSVPVEKMIKEKRINLTFRQYELRKNEFNLNN